MDSDQYLEQDDDAEQPSTSQEYHPVLHSELSSFDHGVAGVMSGIVMRATCQPFDVLKIRFQLQVDPIRRRGKTKGKYYGMRQAITLIMKEEGANALWKGHMPGQYLSAVYGTVQFVSFSWLVGQAEDMLPWTKDSKYSPLVNFVCGALTGTAAITASLPLDVIRTRFVAQGHPRIYKTVADAASQMWHQEGVRAFYRGFVPTVVQIAPFTGCQFAFYRGCVKLWRKMFPDANKNNQSNVTEHGSLGNVGAMQSLVCGSVAGTAAKTAVYPLDMLKKRLQIIGFEHARIQFGTTTPRYRGLIDCALSVIKHEGFMGLYKGMVPSIWKAAVSSGVGFLVYEQMCVLLREHHMQNPREK